MVDVPEPERSAWIDATCSLEPVLAAKLRQALIDDSACAVDLPHAAIVSALSLQQDDPSKRIGQLVGPYRLVRVLGEGGMGVVYLARRNTTDFVQTVALKLIREGKLSEQARQRFLRERSILARLQHANIAHLIDGGVDECGNAWFAMEYVEGEPILSWCDRHRLSTKDRLSLVIEICNAVEYAHSRLVVHRDIKPCNVLVSTAGNIKLLDFGICKLLGEAGVASGDSDNHTRLMTLEYAAPEQFRGDEVTTATDVHAIGLLLYEILCGYAAYSDSSLGIERTIVELEPPEMARRVREGNGDAIAHLRQTNLKALLSGLKADILHIVRKAIRKEPELRYPTPAALREDLQRFLSVKPVTAVGEALTYKLRKFVARNKLVVALSFCSILAILLGMGGVLWQMRLTREEAKSAVAARDFLVGVFQSASPYLSEDGTLTALDIVDAGVRRAEFELEDQPKVQAYLLEALGSSYATLGHRERAKAILRKALLAARTSDRHSLLAQQIALDLAELVARDPSSRQEANELLGEVVELQTREGKANEVFLSRALIAIGLNEFMSQGGSRSIGTMSKAVGISEEHENQVEISLSLESLAYTLAGMRRDLEAIEIYRKVLAYRLDVFGSHSLLVARVEDAIAPPLARAGLLNEAATLLDDARIVAHDFLGSRNPTFVDVSLHYGRVLIHLDRLREADAVIGDALSVIAADPLSEPSRLADAYCIASQLSYAQKKFALAKEQAAESLRIYERTSGTDDLSFVAATTTYAISEFGVGNYSKAEEVFRRLISVERSKNVRFLVPALDYLARTLRLTGRFSEAVRMHTSAVDIGMSQSGDLSIDGSQAKLQLAIDKTYLRDFAGARDDAAAALSSFHIVFKEEHPLVVQAKAVLAEAEYSMAIDYISSR